MTAFCTSCRRSFKEEGHLEQHLRTSSAHKKPTKNTPQVQSSQQQKLVSIQLQQQQQQPSSSRVKPAKPQHTTVQPKHVQPPNTVTVSSYTLQMTKSAIGIVPQVVNSRWSVVAESEFSGVLGGLSANLHSPSELKENGYTLHLYNPLDDINSRKCKRCNAHEAKASSPQCTFHPSKRNKWNLKRPYKCCHGEARGCKTLATHDFQLSLHAMKHKDFLQSPAASAEKPKFRAVTLDCEMAGIASGSSEVIFICATDYVTGALLLKQFVNPTETITQMRSSIHGISKSMLNDAISQGQALFGWEGARSELWKYIDHNTILVGHALEHDLDALRMIHFNVVDSGILSRNAVGIHRIRWGLQTLCSELLDLEIRKNKGGIHDCLEDVLATREVVLFCTQNKASFQNWAEVTKHEELRLEKERKREKEELERARQERQEKKNNQVKKDVVKGGVGISNYTYQDSDDEDEEIVYWSDIAENPRWPHPNTRYNSWSD